MARSRGGGGGGGGGGGARVGHSRSRTLGAPFIKRAVSSFMISAAEELGKAAASVGAGGGTAAARRAASEKLKGSAQAAYLQGSKLMHTDDAAYHAQKKEVMDIKVWPWWWPPHPPRPRRAGETTPPRPPLARPPRRPALRSPAWKPPRRWPRPRRSSTAPSQTA